MDVRLLEMLTDDNEVHPENELFPDDNSYDNIISNMDITVWLIPIDVTRVLIATDVRKVQFLNALAAYNNSKWKYYVIINNIINDDITYTNDIRKKYITWWWWTQITTTYTSIYSTYFVISSRYTTSYWTFGPATSSITIISRSTISCCTRTTISLCTTI